MKFTGWLNKLKNAYLRELRGYRGRFVLAASVLALVLLLIFTLAAQTNDPIPKKIVSSVPFTIYYPNQSALPSGFKLNLSSFQSVSPGVVIYSVSYAGNKEVVFSEQKKPSTNTIKQFAANYIPLHTTFNTPIGNGIYGAYNDGSGLKSVISLPIQNGPWLIVTAPSSLSRAQFIKIIDSLIKAD